MTTSSERVKGASLINRKRQRRNGNAVDDAKKQNPFLQMDETESERPAEKKARASQLNHCIPEQVLGVPGSRIPITEEAVDRRLAESANDVIASSLAQGKASLPAALSSLHLITPRASMSDLGMFPLPSVELNKRPLNASSSDTQASDVTLATSMALTKTVSVTSLERISEEPIAFVKVVSRPFPRGLIKLVMLVVAFVFFKTAVYPLVAVQQPVLTDKDSVYVPGGGFSGFWYILGRLKSIPDPLTKNYYCYSAGCIGVVATLANQSMQEMYTLASAVQMDWKQGKIDHYEVVEDFLDRLVFAHGDVLTEQAAKVFEDPAMLARLNIITTVKGDWGGLKSVVRSPTSLEDLHEMLLQTTWIPLGTGDDLWYKNHMDGAFSLSHHPRCAHSVGLRLRPDLVANILNVNLGKDKVYKFWNEGFNDGL